jgi:hypothetical protein
MLEYLENAQNVGIYLSKEIAARMMQSTKTKGILMIDAMVAGCEELSLSYLLKEMGCL